MLVNDIGVFSVYASKNVDYKTLVKELLPLSLLQMLTLIGILAGTIFHYAEGNSCNQKVFRNGCNGARGFHLVEKKEREKRRQKALNFLEQET